ncbi:MAG: FtsX-like permease family protein, partial [Rhodothermales bacterium]|nr:FtsX-like permease family protein [Rhodothermales bacterium]
MARSARRYFAGHRLQLAMSIIGIAVGVAMVAGVDLATSSASRAFQISAETISGQSSHFITGPGGSLETEAYRKLRVDLGVRGATPVVEGYVRTGQGTFRLLGMDPLSGQATGAGLPGFPEPANLMTTPGGVVLSVDGADRLGVALLDSIPAQVSGRSVSLTVVGIVQAEGAAREGWSDLLVADMATAQEAFGLSGRLTRIELDTSDADAAAVVAALGPGYQLEKPEARTAALAQMTAAFDTNLQALSYLALVVGMFLIFNIMAFSVVQRRPVYSRLRATGVSRRLIARSVLAEAALLGVVGSALGVALGAALGQGLVNLVTRAINDLYFVVSVREVPVFPADLAKAFALGIGASILSAWVPARQAAAVPAADALRRSGDEDRFQARIGSLGATGGVLVLVGYLVIRLPLGIWGGYLGLLMVIMGFSLIGPWVIRALVRLLGRMPLPLTGRMALRGIQTQMSRTSLAIVALSVAVSAAIGVGVMVDSFRGTVVEWLDMTLRADLYISPPSAVARLGGGMLEEESLNVLRSHPDVEQAYGVRRVEVQGSDGPIALVVIEHGPRSQASYRFVNKAEGLAETDQTGSGEAGGIDDPGDDAVWRAFSGGAVFVSEPFAYRKGVEAG